MTTTYAAPGTPSPYSELASVFAGFNDIRHNDQARAQSARLPHIPIKKSNNPTRK